MRKFNYYSIAGFTLRSTIPLSYLNRTKRKKPDIIVELGIAERIKSKNESTIIQQQGASNLICAEKDFYLHIDKVANFRIQNRTKIFVQLYNDKSKLDLALPYLYGTVFSVLMHMHLKFPIHGSAVLGKKGINMFCAHSGTGKSTLAFNLFKLGYPLFADDKCIFSWDSILKKYTATPEIRAVRLWQDSIDNLNDNQTLTDGVQMIAKENKFQFNLDDQMYDRIHMLNKVFVIRKVNNLKNITIRMLNVAEKKIAIRNQLHRPDLIVGGPIKNRFELFVKNFSRLVPIYFVRRPVDIPIKEFVDFIEKQIDK